MDTFTYLDLTTSSSTSCDAEISFKIAKAAAIMAKLNKRVWGNDLLSEMTKMCVCQACVLSTLHLWQRVVDDLCQTRAATQRIPPPLPAPPLHIRWQDRVTNTKVLERVGSLSMPSLLIQLRLGWLGHARGMEPDRLPRKILYGELREGIRCMGRPLLRYKDVIK